MALSLDHIERARAFIPQAIRIENIDEALALLMAEAAIKTGDVAGQFFSEYDDLDDHWEGLGEEARSQLLSRYLDVEKAFVAA